PQSACLHSTEPRSRTNRSNRGRASVGFLNRENWTEINYRLFNFFFLSAATRRHEVAGIRSKFPNKIPVIIERYEKEKYLPPLDKTKFLVPHELTMTQFVTIIRNRMALLPSQAFYLLINNSGLASMSLTMAQVYKDHQDEDGFLYMTYASQEMFGH
uniref:Microtubule-associated protein 1 light chain 3 gamma n=1 Tax=Cyprinodon variegatus TaxID=28743 RepID=A0A3Q2CLI3_CYPVA